MISVSPTAHANGTGSPSDPMPLAAALARIERAGDLIALAPGRYAPGRLVCSLRGRPDSPWVIDGGGAAIIDADSARGGVTPWGIRFDKGAEHVILRNSRITDSNPNKAAVQTGIGVSLEDCSNISILHCQIDNHAHQGIITKTTFDGGLVLEWNIVTLNGSAKSLYHGAYLGGKGSLPNKIRGNIIANNFAYQLHCYSSSTALNVSNFEIRDNIVAKGNSHNAAVADRVGVLWPDAAGLPKGSGNVIAGNVFIGDSDESYFKIKNCTGVLTSRNLFHRCKLLADTGNVATTDGNETAPADAPVIRYFPSPHFPNVVHFAAIIPQTDDAAFLDFSPFWPTGGGHEIEIVSALDPSRPDLVAPWRGNRLAVSPRNQSPAQPVWPAAGDYRAASRVYLGKATLRYAAS